jgi:hypothetical protein
VSTRHLTCFRHRPMLLLETCRRERKRSYLSGIAAEASLWAGRKHSAIQRLAAAIVVMPANANSFGRRSAAFGSAL